MLNFIKNILNNVITLSQSYMTPKLTIKNKYLKYYGRKRIKPVYGIIIHYISAIYISPRDPYNLEKIINIFNTYKVSADYLIDRQGIIYKLIPDGSYSYHAGVSQMTDGTYSLTRSGKKTVNDITVGIELMGTATSGFTDAQYNSLIALTKKLMQHYNIKDLNRIEGHEHVCIPKSRKKDPGKLFDWERYKSSL